jgi:hypothetical protein
MRIVWELAAERNPVAKIAFLTRLTEEAVREILGLAVAAGAEVRACAPATRKASTGSVVPPSPAAPRPHHADVLQLL